VLPTGAGPAGVSAAYTLSTSFKSKDVSLEIVLFEQKASIGGRMVTNHAFPKERLGREVHPEDVASGQIGGNSLRNRARELGFDYRLEKKLIADEVGFFNGQDIVAKLTRPMDEMSWRTWLTLVLKYRFSLWNAKQLPKGTMKTFDKLLESRSTFERVSEMTKSAGIDGAVGLGAVVRLSANGVGGDYIHEVLRPQVLRQTGQYVTELSDLAISMGLQREDQCSAGYRGSFARILDNFVQRSRAELRLSTKVTSLKRELTVDGGRSWVLELQKTGHSEVKSEVFDHVIVAGPSSSLLKHIYHDEEVFYRDLFVTFLVSTKELDKKYFGGSDNIPSQILPIQSDRLRSDLEGIHEISYVGDTFGPDLNAEAVGKLYRILSDRSVSRQQILAFGGEAVLEIYEENIEHAYPLTWPRNGKFGEFKLKDGLWHTGVVETIGSSVELSWVGGENVGRLVARSLGRGVPRKQADIPKMKQVPQNGIMK
jgi:prenylcysteine oxidase/farnesylcysteine lyase